MTYQERYPNEPKHFNNWWAEQIAGGEKPENVLLARAAWNQALDLAAEHFGDMEGTSFGVECILRAVAPNDPSSPTGGKQKETA